jgi:hypothetical protein
LYSKRIKWIGACGWLYRSQKTLSEGSLRAS